VKIPAIVLASFATVFSHAAPKAPPQPPSFYTQSLDAGGITIRASSKADVATLETVKARILRVVANTPMIATNLKKAKVEMHIISRGEKITDLPEYAPFATSFANGSDSFEHRFHGGKPTGTMLACSEENVMRDKSDPYPKDYDVCTHELAHAVLTIGLDAAAREKVVARFNAAKSEGLYEDQYAGTSPDEFFAEGSAHYFGYSGGGLKESDPATFVLLDSFYGGFYANTAAPVSDLTALAGNALAGAHSSPGKSLTGVILKNKSATELRESELDGSGKIIASIGRLVPSGSEDAFQGADGTTIILIDEKTKGIVATVALQNNFGRFSVDDKMVKAERAPTPDELTRASAPIRINAGAQ
jgi:hypothetical protein